MICQDIGEPPTLHWIGFQAAFVYRIRQPETVSIQQKIVWLIPNGFAFSGCFFTKSNL
nr:hypothetical protein [uncultured Kingella sp.]